jgi:hypothetical protein
LHKNVGVVLHRLLLGSHVAAQGLVISYCSSVACSFST